MIKLFVLILFTQSLFAQSIQDRTWTVCLNDGSKCYDNVTIIKKLHSDNYLAIRYFDMNTNTIRFGRIRKPYTLIQKEKKHERIGTGN